MRRIKRSGGLGDVLFLRGPLEALGEPVEVITSGTIVEAQWAMPPNVTLKETGKWDTDLDPLFEYHKWRLSVDRPTQAEVAITGQATTTGYAGFRMPVEARTWASKALSKLGTNLPVVAIADSSFGEHRKLPRKWAGEAAGLLQEAGYYPLVLGWKTGMTKAEADTRFAGKTTITQAAALLDQCAGFLCCDTGLTALAAYLEVPQAVLYQSQLPWLRLPRLPGRFIGYHCAARSVPSIYGGDFACGELPPAAEVVDGLLTLLKGEAIGCYWADGWYFDDPLKAYYWLSEPLEGPALWDLLAALEETQAAVMTQGGVTACRLADKARAPWIARGLTNTGPLKTLLTADRQATIQNAVLRRLDCEGACAEVGVYEGGITRLMAETAPHKRVYGFDTFSGIPGQLRHTLDHHVAGEFAASYEGVSEYLADLPNVELRRGTFPATAKGLSRERFAVVHLDGDLYETTRAGLEFFWPRLAEGGIIVLDDYGWRDTAGVTQATDEFLKEHPEALLEVTAPIQATVRRVKTRPVVKYGVRYVTGDGCWHRELGLCKRGEFIEVENAATRERLATSRHFEAVTKTVQVQDDGGQ